LRASGFFGPDDNVVLFNTGSGLKYLNVIDSHTQSERESALASRHIAGIIGPY
jgi:threonine synthase